MAHRSLAAIAVVLVAALATACGATEPSASQQPRAASFDEYAVAACSSFEALFRAVGNPDTGSGSALSNSLDEAVAAGAVTVADRVAAETTMELESGRMHASIAAGWQPGAASMAALDRVLVAFEAMTAAKRATAKDPATVPTPQQAFERAGGADAWFAMLRAVQQTARPAGATVHQCAEVPIGF